MAAGTVEQVLALEDVSVVLSSGTTTEGTSKIG